MDITAFPEFEAFVLHWGEMGTHWGINRSVAQVHALLYLADRPLHAEEIAGSLKLARSNVSTALKELQAYAIVRRTHVAADRRDHFVAETDLWEMLMRISAERKRREIDPTVAFLAELKERIDVRGDVPPHVRSRIADMHDFLSGLADWSNQVRRLPRPTLVKLMKMGAKVARFVGGGRSG
jgi:DNA-binding transcriptional regulator GbsR (MarR family)